MKNGTFAEAIKVGFTSEQAGMLSRFGCETRSEAIEAIEQKDAARESRFSWRRRLLRAAFIYGLDMGLAVVGLTVGFGLSVENWPALIGAMVVLRFLVHTLAVAAYRSDALACSGNSVQRHEVADLNTLLDNYGIPPGPLGWRVMELRADAIKERDDLLAVLEETCALLRKMAEESDGDYEDVDVLEAIIEHARKVA
jgi:hypothetical protein